jgi:hypothetical protein
MKRFILFFFVLFISVQVVHAQTASNSEIDSSKTAQEQNKNAIYLSVGGPAAGLYSINYERKIREQLWARAGFTYGLTVFNFLLSGEKVSVPLGVNKLFGRESKFFEAGLGTTLYFSDIDTSLELFGEDENANNNIAPDFNIFLTSSFNYRYQPTGENFIFKIGLSPIFILSTGDFFPLLGISIGGAF